MTAQRVIRAAAFAAVVVFASCAPAVPAHHVTHQCATPVHFGHATWTECRYSNGTTVTTETTTR